MISPRLWNSNRSVLGPEYIAYVGSVYTISVLLTLWGKIVWVAVKCNEGLPQATNHLASFQLTLY